MALVWVKEEWFQRGADGDGLLKQQVVRSWLIKMDAIHDQGQVYLLAAASLPGRFDPHPTLLLATARRIRIKQLTESPFFWRVTITYSSEPINKEDKDTEENEDPLDRPPRISIDREQFEIPVFEDREGEAILNSAGDPYIDPIVWPASRKRYNVVYNAAAIPTWHDDLEGKTNDGNVTITKGATAKTYDEDQLLYMPGPISDLKEENGVAYMEIGFSLLVKRETWTVRMLDNGYQYLDSGTKKVIVIEGDRPTDPQLLDGSGGLLASPSPSTAVYNDHDIPEQGDMSPLPLDDT